VLEEFRRELLGVDWGRTAEAVEAFIAEKVDGAGVRGVVLGLSGTRRHWPKTSASRRSTPR